MTEKQTKNEKKYEKTKKDSKRKDAKKKTPKNKRHHFFLSNLVNWAFC